MGQTHTLQKLPSLYTINHAKYGLVAHLFYARTLRKHYADFTQIYLRKIKLKYAGLLQLYYAENLQINYAIYIHEWFGL